jgi:putative membrane protein
MIALRLAASELRRLTTGRMPRIALAAIMIVPLLYGGFYLYANWDPYSNLSEVPAALVVADQGATADGKVLRAGADVRDELIRQHTFDWTEVSAADADAGVRNGRFTFAVTLPAGFSESLASPASTEARQGMLILTTNDANSYTGSTVGHRVVEEVRRTVAAKAGSAAAERMLAGFSTIQQKTAEAASGSGQLANGAERAASGASQLAGGSAELADGLARLHTGSGELASGATAAADGARRLHDGAGRLARGLGEARDKTAGLPAQTAQLAAGARQVALGNAQLAAKANTIAAAANAFTAQVTGSRAAIVARMKDQGVPQPVIDAVMAELDKAGAKVVAANGEVQKTAGDVTKLSNGASQVATGAARLAANAPQLTSGIARAADGAEQLSTGAGSLDTGLHTLGAGAGRLDRGLADAAAGARKLAGGSAALRTGTAQLADGSSTLATRLAEAAGQIPHPDERHRKAIARVIGDPVAIRGVGQATAETYGAGLAPFFLGLALWVGAFTLFMLVRPLSRRALAARQRAWPVAIGGWLPAAVLGAIQAVLLFTFAVVLIGVSPAHPVGTLAFMLLAGLAFTAIVHALNAFFGPAGKFLALVMLVLQLTTAGGTFPWQTTPGPLHPLHAALPLSYVVDGLRHLLYGGGLAGLGTDVAVLAAYLGGALAMSALAGHRHRIWTGSRLRPELVL